MKLDLNQIIQGSRAMRMRGPAVDLYWYEEEMPDGTRYSRSDSFLTSDDPDDPVALWTVLQRGLGIQKFAAIRQVLAGRYPDIARDELAWLGRDGTLHPMTMPISRDDRKPFVWSSMSEAKRAAEKKEKGVLTLAGWREADFSKKKRRKGSRIGPPLAGSQGNAGLKIVWDRGEGGFWYYSSSVTTSEGVVYWKVNKFKDGGWVAMRTWGRPGRFAWLGRDGVLRDSMASVGVWKTSREAKEAAQKKERGVLTLAGWREADFGPGKPKRTKVYDSSARRGSGAAADPQPSLLGETMKAPFGWTVGPLSSVKKDWGWYSDWRYNPLDRSSFEWLVYKPLLGDYVALRTQMDGPHGGRGRYSAWWLDRNGRFHTALAHGSQKRLRDLLLPDEAFVWKDQHEAMEAAGLREGGQLTLAGWRQAVFPLRGSRTSHP